MKTYKIFTSGRMSGLAYDRQNGWQRRIEDLIKNRTDKSVVFVHPPMFYQYEENNPQNDIESMNWEMNQLIDSDVLIVDLNDISYSIGTHIKLGIAAAVNKIALKNIFIVGVGKPDTNHPWIVNGMFHCEETPEDAADYIVNNLLV